MTTPASLVTLCKSVPGWQELQPKAGKEPYNRLHKIFYCFQNKHPLTQTKSTFFDYSQEYTRVNSFTFGSSKKISDDPINVGASPIKERLFIFSTAMEENTIDNAMFEDPEMVTCNWLEEEFGSPFSSSHLKAL